MSFLFFLGNLLSMRIFLPSWPGDKVKDLVAMMAPRLLTCSGLGFVGSPNRDQKAPDRLTEPQMASPETNPPKNTSTG